MTMTEPTTDLTRVGTKVTIDHPREHGNVFVVVKKMPRNVKVRREGVPNAPLIVCDPLLLRPVPERRLGVEYVPPKIFNSGETVTLKGKPGIFVVLKSTTKGYSVAPLGGDNGRYWNAPAVLLDAVKIKYEKYEIEETP